MVDKAVYLGSTLSREGTCTKDVESRVNKAAAAFGKLSPLVFKNKDISMNAKKVAYIAIVVSILLYGCELWALTAAGRRKLRAFHHRCVRSICGVNMWHVQHHEISNVEILKRASLMSIDTYMARRRLRWIGHVSRMSWGRAPRKLLSSWVYQGRPRGRPCMRWAESIEIDLKLAGIPISKWAERAEDKSKWRTMTRKLGEPKGKKRRKTAKNKDKT